MLRLLSPSTLRRVLPAGEPALSPSKGLQRTQTPVNCNLVRRKHLAEYREFRY